ncbi:MAG TPA: YheC/YheD family protein [Syntrophomonadaceae bacterium]|nr:YheC/YheD family protein [Syntrophomonadaceae bacterium]
MQVVGRIFLSDRLVENLGINVQPLVQVRVGCLVVTTEMVVKADERATYTLSPALAQALYVHKQKRLQIRYDSKYDMLHLGPTIGIFATSLPNRGYYEPTHIGAELIFLSHISNTLPGQTYIFTPASINWDNLTVRGYSYRPNSSGRGVWVSSLYPLPDVVYDRVSTRSGEARDQIRNTKIRLMQQPYLNYFNPSFLNKWKVHQMLLTNPWLHKHLPETRPLTAENLEEMLKIYKIVYVKPSNGSLGLGIIRVTLDQKGNLNYVVHRSKRFRSVADNATDFMSRTRKIRADKPYIVQQGINIATYHGSPFDIRIIYQKNRHGEWQIGKKFARVAPKGSSVSNLSSGGKALPIKILMRAMFRKADLIEEKNRQIKEVCYQVAQTIEKTSQMIYGELGLDLGLDKSGHIWLIEVNSKPRKTTETQLSKIIMRNAFKRPLEFSTYLAGF